MTLPHFYYAFYILDIFYIVWYYIIKEREKPLRVLIRRNKMIKLYDKQVDVIVECETRSLACKYVSDHDLCVWEMNGDEWEVRPRREMFKGLQCMQGGY